MSKNIKGYDGVLATRLRNLMSESKTTQLELAKSIGITRQSVSQYMDGSMLPNAEKLYLIANFFNVSADYLFGNTDVRSFSTDIISVCNFTGLIEGFVKYLSSSHIHKLEIINAMFKTNFIQNIVDNIEYEISVLIMKQGWTKNIENFAITRSLDGKFFTEIELERKDLDVYFKEKMGEIKRKVVDKCNNDIEKILNDIFDLWSKEINPSISEEMFDKAMKKSFVEYHIHDKMLWYGNKLAKNRIKSSD